MQQDKIIKSYRIQISNFNLLMKILLQLPGNRIWIENNMLFHKHQEMYYRCDLSEIRPLNQNLFLCFRKNEKILKHLASYKTNNDITIDEYNDRYEIKLDQITASLEKEFISPQNDLQNDFKKQEVTQNTTISNPVQFKKFVSKKKFIDVYVNRDQITKLLDENDVTFEIFKDEAYKYILRVFNFLSIGSYDLKLQVFRFTSNENELNIIDELSKSFFLKSENMLNPKIIINQLEQAYVVADQYKDYTIGEHGAYI